MIDVVVPIYNNASTLNETMESVVRQTIFRDVRVLICDDCSTDESLRLINQWCERFKNIESWPNATNLGVMGNYRRLAGLCRSEFIAPIEGDDVWISTERLEILRNYMIRSEAHFCFNGFLVRQQNAYTKGAASLGERYRQVSAFELIEANLCASFSNCFYRAEAFRVGLEKTAKASGYDWLLNTLLAHHYGGMSYVPAMLSSYYVSPTGTWSSLSRAEKAEMISKSILEMKELLPSLYQSSLSRKLARNEMGLA